jgi:adenylate cyclase
MSSLHQRLVAILAADATGYSRLMAADEHATIAALDEARAVFRRLIEAHQGRVIDMAGDSVLAVFNTAGGAVAAAVAVQAELHVRSTQVPETRRMLFRIGLHLGDVVEKSDGTVYGDGVNIAARLQTRAEPGGVMVSDAIHSAVRGRLDVRWTDVGEQTAKNIPYPVRAWSIDTSAAALASAITAGSAPAAPPRPTIAVLPFKVLAEDPRLCFLADGLVEDVVALLARVTGFELISHSSTFDYRGRQQSVSTIARELGVRYVVEGSLRPAGDEVRIAVQLTDAGSARVLWSGRFAGRADNLPDLQDDIARGVISELEPELTRAEIELIRRLRPENVDAWGHYRQGVGATALRGWTGEAIEEARARLSRAFELDPKFAQARAQFALVTAVGIKTCLIPDTVDTNEEALQAAEQSIALDDGSTAVLGYAGCALWEMGQHERGAEILQRALQIDPSNAHAHVALGACLCQMGQFDDGLERMRYGMRISPRDRRLGFWGWAISAYLLRANRVEEALVEARASARRDPRLHLSRIAEAAALEVQGRTPEARSALAEARRIRPMLTAQEVARTHGKRAAARLLPLWNA